jgi:lipopolysaccharide export system protein LptA
VQFTIERLRTLVLAAGVVLIGSLILFLARGRLKNPLNLKELPQKLGVNIQSDATTFTIDHALGGHSRYRIHAAKAVQYKDNRAILKDVQIELYAEDGSPVDRIEGAEFEYDQKNGTATASGPVSITLTRPAAAAPQSLAKIEKGKPTPIASATEAASRGQVNVKTSGLTFDTKSGVARTAERVDFSTIQGSGTSIGASYDSKGFLVLEKAVELNTVRSGQTIALHAEHAEFERETLLCRLHAATAAYRGGHAVAGDANVLFRSDGSAVRLDATNGFSLETATGGHIVAPSGTMDFDEHNQPQRGRMQGGVVLDSTRLSKDGAAQQRMRATSPVVDLAFGPKGQLRTAHLERGVEMRSDLLTENAKGAVRASRTWASPIAELTFRDNGHGQAEPATMYGNQGVVVTSSIESGNAPPQPSRFSADEMTGQFGPNSVLASMSGSGHTSLDTTNAAGTRQTSSGDRLEAHFETGAKAGGKAGNALPQSGMGQIQSTAIDGNVVLAQTPAATSVKAGSESSSPLRAWAGHAVYDGAGEWLHLTQNPRVEDGGLQMTAEKMDVSHSSGDAFAHGNVKATYLGGDPKRPRSAGSASPGAGPLGGQGPAHMVADEVQIAHTAASASAEITFKGHARLWQQANSVTAPVIVLDRQRETLVAHSADPANPVRVVLLSSGGLDAHSATGKTAPGSDAGASTPARTPSVIRLRGGDLKYSDAERKALMRGGELAKVVAETPTATSISNEVELQLLPAGNHAGTDGGQAQVDRMTARGSVLVTSGSRRGTGEQLLYSGETGEYVLTGTPASPPTMTDSARGTVSGDALIFHSRDDHVTIEGGGGRTTTQTTAPK